MASILKETPTWVIDGNNKIFTLLNEPDYIDDLFFDWAIYVSFTLVGKVITLTDAPTLSLFVDYETTITTVNPQTDLKWGDIKEQIWVNLWQTANSTTFSDAIVNNEMNWLVSDIYRGRVQNPLNWKIYRAGQLNFINWLTSFRTVNDTKLTAELNPWDIVVEMSTIWLTASGTVLIGWDIISYTNKTDSQIEWITGATIKHLVSETATTIYKMPDEFDKPTTANYISNDNSSSEILFNPEWNIAYYFQVIKDVNYTSYIKVVWLLDDSIIRMNYIKTHAKITDSETKFPLPDLYGYSVVANIVAWKLGYTKSMPNSEQQLMMWFSTLQSFYQFYTSDINVIKQSIQIQTSAKFLRKI